jgi:hypothetical protein
MRLLPSIKMSWLCALIALCAFATSSFAAPPIVKLTLVWGTDEEKPADPKLKPADAKMVEQFRQMCKWKNYFEVTNTTATVTAATSKIRLSPKCELELQTVDKDLAAKFFGEGKLIYQGKSKMESGKHWGIAGSDKNATAWFVVLTPL